MVNMAKKQGKWKFRIKITSRFHKVGCSEWVHLKRPVALLLGAGQALEEEYTGGDSRLG